MEIIKYEGFDSNKNKYFTGLIKEKEKYYYIFIGKVSNIYTTSDQKVNIINDNISFINNIHPRIEISLKEMEDNTLFKLFKLNSQEEYDTIVSVIKELL